MCERTRARTRERENEREEISRGNGFARKTRSRVRISSDRIGGLVARRRNQKIRFAEDSTRERLVVERWPKAKTRKRRC